MSSSQLPLPAVPLEIKSSEGCMKYGYRET
jgi:hypothetical protein